MSVDRFDYSVCGVCARNTAGGGYMPRHKIGKCNAQALWLCDDPECLPIARNTYSMKQDDFDRLEAMATQDAGRKLEEFCDGIGKSDLRTMTQEEFDQAMREIVAEYRYSLKVKLKDEAPF